MWHWAQVLGRRAIRTELVWRVVASGAGANGAIGVGLANAVALLAAAGHGGIAFELSEGMRRPARAAGLITFGEVDLLGSEPFSP